MHPIAFPRAMAALVILSCLTVSATAQTTLKVLTAGAFKQVVLAFVTDFEAQANVKLNVDNDTAGALIKRIQAGEEFDLLFLPPNALAALSAQARIDPKAVFPIAKVGIGVAVKTGAPHPPLETTAQFIEAVVKARKVAYIDPSSGGSSGIYIDGLFRRLGIVESVRAKSVLVPGGLVAERITTGDADLAIHQVSEILPVKGVDLVGLLPEAIQNYTTYAAAVSISSLHAAHAQAFIALLTSPDASSTIRAKGMLSTK